MMCITVYVDRKLSNPFNNMGLVMSRVAQSWRNKNDPPLVLGLAREVHPNLSVGPITFIYLFQT